MPIYVAPFGLILGALLAAYGLLRPASEIEQDRHAGWRDYGWPITKLIAWLPRPLSRGVWLLLGLIICAGSIEVVVSKL